MNEAVIVSAARTPVGKGKKDGALASVHPADLSARVLREVMDRAGLDPAEVEDVLWGCAMPEGSQGLNVARLALLHAGFPVEVSGTTINRFCSSGLQTIAMGAQAIMSGMADVVVAGGVEMMSQVPMSGHHTRLHPRLLESYIGMGFTAERVAERWGVSREDQDAWAIRSQQRAARAQAEGTFDREIVPVTVQHERWSGAEKEVREVQVAQDELVRADSSIEKLSQLRPAFKVKGSGAGARPFAWCVSSGRRGPPATRRTPRGNAPPPGRAPSPSRARSRGSGRPASPGRPRT